MTGSVRFTGETTGHVSLAFSAGTGLIIASQLLGGGDAGEHSREAINDAIGELVNIVTGNLQSKLSDAGLKSEVGLPEVSFRNYLPRRKRSRAARTITSSSSTACTASPPASASTPQVSAPASKSPTRANSWRLNEIVSGMRRNRHQIQLKKYIPVPTCRIGRYLTPFHELQNPYRR